jgi:hypothetical protein
MYGGYKAGQLAGRSKPIQIIRAAESEGGFGVLGRHFEGAHAITSAQQEALRREILSVAKSREFLKSANLLGKENRAVRLQFWDLLREAEVVGSTKGGAAGLIRLSGESADKLRIAILVEGTYLGLSRQTIIKHELGHFVREANALTNGRNPFWFMESQSLFEQERRAWMYPYNATIVLLREEGLVWYFTIFK